MMESSTISDVVAVRLRRLSSGTKRGLWRARQLQARAYNWGVEHALGLHADGKFIASPRNDSKPLTRIRHTRPDGLQAALDAGERCRVGGRHRGNPPQHRRPV